MFLPPMKIMKFYCIGLFRHLIVLLGVFYSVTRDRSTGLDYLGVNGVVTSFKMHEYNSIDDGCNIGYLYSDANRDMNAWLDDICIFDDVIPEFKYNYSVPTSYMSDFYLNRYSAYEDKEILYSYKK